MLSVAWKSAAPTEMIWILFLTIWNLNAANSDVADLLGKHGVQLKSSSTLKLKSQSSQKADARSIEKIALESEEVAMEMTFVGPLTNEQFENYKKLEMGSVMNLFLGSITPYPGQISTKSDCPKQFQPVTENSTFLKHDAAIIFLKASERHTFGVCTSSLAYYDAALTLVHLPDQTALKIEAFTRSPKPHSTLLKTFNDFN